MNFHIVTLFPGAFDSYIGESIIKRAIEDKKIKIKFYDPKNYEKDPKKRVDDKPYGGGPGMVVRALPTIKAIEAAVRASSKKSKPKIIFLSPGGKQFETMYAKSVAKKHKDIIIVSGRYEGIDARVKKVFRMEDVSIGPFVLTGGELPAMIIVDCVARQVEGVLGNFDSLEESRVASSDVYTRPDVFEYKKKKYRVPKVLLSGNHKMIEEWRKNK
ncbi:MAG TPA: tRNA (guanosine(37)-N1)-methyltransferase TrmD [Candidatus Nanoarchaeia archaeon]|nr:tRNA (guanosine(37)-N1)-methyltransferase TrmD [Candidatus Nanoarchaeia archaeon]